MQSYRIEDDLLVETWITMRPLCHVMGGRCTETLDESEEVSWPAHQVLEIILGWSDRSRSERNYGSLN